MATFSYRAKMASTFDNVVGYGRNLSFLILIANQVVYL